MKGTTYGWLAWATVNAAAGAGVPAGYEVAQSAGLGPVASGAVTLAADTRALLDLNAVYGPYAAVLGPALATVSGQLCGGHSAVPVVSSLALAVLARSAATRKGAVT